MVKAIVFVLMWRDICLHIVNGITVYPRMYTFTMVHNYLGLDANQNDYLAISAMVKIIVPSN